MSISLRLCYVNINITYLILKWPTYNLNSRATLCTKVIIEYIISHLDLYIYIWKQAKTLAVKSFLFFPLLYFSPVNLFIVCSVIFSRFSFFLWLWTKNEIENRRPLAWNYYVWYYYWKHWFYTHKQKML